MTAQHNPVRRGPAPRTTKSSLGAAAALVATALLSAVSYCRGFSSAYALKAAGGFNDVKPIQGMSHFVDALQGNLSWLFITALVLVVVTVGFLFMAGHSRAHDFALRVVVGVAIVACSGGIVA